MDYLDYRRDFLAHHGIKGQKWGVRRFQRRDGSLTEEGKKAFYKKDGFSLNEVGKNFYGITKEEDELAKEKSNIEKEFAKRWEASNSERRKLIGPVARQHDGLTTFYTPGVEDQHDYRYYLYWHTRMALNKKGFDDKTIDELEKSYNSKIKKADEDRYNGERFIRERRYKRNTNLKSFAITSAFFATLLGTAVVLNKVSR